MMRVEVLTVPDCPNGPKAIRHLAEALAGRPGVEVGHRVVSTPEEAARYGMHGSPTILIDGRDPFAEAETTASLACRLYRDADGRVEGAPSAGQLREALAASLHPLTLTPPREPRAARPLPRGCFELERRRIFHRKWFCAGRASRPASAMNSSPST